MLSKRKKKSIKLKLTREEAIEMTAMLERLLWFNHDDVVGNTPLSLFYKLECLLDAELWSNHPYYVQDRNTVIMESQPELARVLGLTNVQN